MRTVDLIHRKRDGEELSPEELHFLVDGYTRGEIPELAKRGRRQTAILAQPLVGTGQVAGTIVTACVGGATLLARDTTLDALHTVAGAGRRTRRRRRW